MNFWQTHKVFIVGLIQFILTSLTELFMNDTGGYSTYIIIYSAVIAALTYLGKNLRGQWASIISAVTSSVMVFGGLHDSNLPITFQIIATRMLLPLSLAILGIFYTSPPKSTAYEQQQSIMDAKITAQLKRPNPLAKTDVKKEADKIKNA